jgi:hypothetical protein
MDTIQLPDSPRPPAERNGVDEPELSAELPRPNMGHALANDSSW